MTLTIVASVLWGSTYPVIQQGLGYYDAFQISFLRALFATIALVIYSTVNRKTRTQLFQAPGDRNSLLLLLAASAFGAVGFWTFLNLSVRYLASDTSSFLVALYPLITVVLASFLLRDRITVARGLGVGLGIFGTYVIVGFGESASFSGSNPTLGALVALAAAFSWSACLITTKILIGRKDKRTGFEYTPEFVTLSIFSISIIPTFVIVVLAGDWRGLLSSSVQGFAIVLYLGAITSALAFLIFNMGMKIIGVSRAAINQLLFPIVTVVLSYYMFGETINLASVLGIALILLGVAVAQR